MQLVYRIMKKVFIFLFICLSNLFSCKKKADIESLFNSVFEMEIGYSADNIIGYASAFKINDDYCLSSAHNVVYKNNNDEYITYSYIVGRVYNSNIKIEFKVNDYNYEDDYVKLVPYQDSKETFDQIKSLSYSISNDYEIGSFCFSVGNLNNCGLSYNTGTISSKLKKIKYHNKENYFIQTSIEIAKGVSGCPLFNDKYEVIGIMTFKLRDSNYEYIDGLSFALPLTAVFADNSSY